MRTLKKTLCLVLCLAMMVGMCAIAASATDFTDDADIENKEEVDLVTGLGIIKGYPDGSFKPEKILTRAEACKIIAYLMEGEDAAEALAKADTQFPDVTKAHWASGFIGYCAVQGIVEGYPDGTFKPSEPLTAAAWGKMLLCALGYDQTIEGMTGSNWDFNVTRLVAKTKLADGFAFTADTEMSRDAACVMAFNALTVPKVHYEGGVNVSTSDGTTVTVDSALVVGEDGYFADNYSLDIGNENKTAYDKRGFGDDSVIYGVIIVNAANSQDSATTTLDAVFGGDAEGDIAFETGEDLLGHYVKVYCAVKNNDPDLDTIYSVADLSTVKTVARAIAAGEGADDKFIAAFGKKAAVAPGYAVIGDPVAVVGRDADHPDTAAAAAATYFLTETADGVFIVCAMNADYVEYTLTKVKKIVDTEGKETIELTGMGVKDNGKLDAAKEPVDVVREYDGIAEGDYVLVAKMGQIYTLSKTTTVEGSISKIGTAGAAAGTVTLDGEDYPMFGNDIAEGAVAALVDSADIGAAQMKKNTYRLYLSEDGEWLAIEQVTGSTPVVTYFVVDAYDKEETVDYGTYTNTYLQVLDAEGAESQILVGAKKGEEAQQGKAIGETAEYEGKFVTFGTTGLTDGQKKLGMKVPTKVADDINLAADPAVLSGQAEITDDAIASTDTTIETALAGTVYVDASTVYIFADGTLENLDVEVVKGAVNVDIGADAQVYFAADKDGNRIAKVIVICDEYEDKGIAADTLLYFSKETTKDNKKVDGFTYTVYNAVTGEKTTVTGKEDKTYAQGFHSWSDAGDDIVNIVYAVADDTAVNTKLFNSVTYSGKRGTAIHFLKGEDEIELAVTDNTVIVDTRAATAIGDEGTLDSVDAIAKAAAANNGAKKVYLSVLKNAKGEATIIFVYKYAAPQA